MTLTQLRNIILAALVMWGVCLLVLWAMLRLGALLAVGMAG